MSRIAFVLSCVALFCVSTVPAASADPLTLTDGTIWATGAAQAGPAAFVALPNFSFVGQVSPTEGRIDPFTECSPCLPGSTISVGGNLSGSALEGFATLGGTTYVVGPLDAPAALMLDFTGHAVVPPSSRFPMLVSAPFTVTGQFFIHSGGVDPDTAVPMAGGGIVSMVLFSMPLGGNSVGWVADQVRYDFSESAPPTPTPVPEPAALGTIAFGLAALARRARTRRTRRG